MEDIRRIPRYSSSSSSSFPRYSDSEMEELQRLENALPFWTPPEEKKLSRQLSMCEKPGDITWEKRRRQKVEKERKNKNEDLTDEDLNELKGCIELGFGFKEKEGQMLCNTLPALDLYFAVNRQYWSSSTSPISTLSPGDDPQQVKTKLRHWAQAVACSVLQSH